MWYSSLVAKSDEHTLLCACHQLTPLSCQKVLAANIQHFWCILSALQTFVVWINDKVIAALGKPEYVRGSLVVSEVFNMLNAFHSFKTKRRNVWGKMSPVEYNANKRINRIPHSIPWSVNRYPHWPHVEDTWQAMPRWWVVEAWMRGDWCGHQCSFSVTPMASWSFGKRRPTVGDIWSPSEHLKIVVNYLLIVNSDELSH